MIGVRSYFANLTEDEVTDVMLDKISNGNKEIKESGYLIAVRRKARVSENYLGKKFLEIPNEIGNFIKFITSALDYKSNCPFIGLYSRKDSDIVEVRLMSEKIALFSTETLFLKLRKDIELNKEEYSKFNKVIYDVLVWCTESSVVLDKLEIFSKDSASVFDSNLKGTGYIGYRSIEKSNYGLALFI